MTSNPGIYPRPQWWKALTNTPILFLCILTRATIHRLIGWFIHSFMYTFVGVPFILLLTYNIYRCFVGSFQQQNTHLHKGKCQHGNWIWANARNQSYSRVWHTSEYTATIMCNSAIFHRCLFHRFPPMPVLSVLQGHTMSWGSIKDLLTPCYSKGIPSG